MIQLRYFETFRDGDMVPYETKQEKGFIELSPEALDAIAEAVTEKMVEKFTTESSIPKTILTDPHNFLWRKNDNKNV